MRNIKKLMALGLTATITMSAIGCGSNGDANTEAPATEAPVEGTDTAEGDATEAPVEEGVSPYTVITDADGNPYDLGGAEIIIADWWSGDPAEPTNDYEEARQEYRDWIQETYNFTIKELAWSTWGDMPADFVNYATTGGDENYVFVLRQSSELVSAMASGLMYDLSTLDCLDFTEDKWKASNVVDLMTAKSGAVYGMRGIEPEARGGVYFNKRILTEAGIDPEELYTLQENGEWTWAKFEEMCEQINADTDNDGNIDRYALSNANNSFMSEAVWSNGGEFFGRDADGNYYNAVESDATMEALNWCMDMRDKYEITFPEDANWDYFYDAFNNGEYAFLFDQAYRAGNMTDNADDFGFVCFPMGPQATDYVSTYGDNVFVIPACYDAEKAWNIAFAYNLYTEPVPGYEDYAAWKTNYYQNFRDTESVDLTIARLMSNGHITFDGMIAGIDMGPDFWWNINKDNTPAQQAEAVRNTWQSFIDATNGQ